jgi:solute carrier family 35 protein E3
MSLPLQAAALGFNLVSGCAIVLVNKQTLAQFPFPTTLTAVHYATNYVFVLGLLSCRFFEQRRLSRADLWPLIATTAVWAAHNALSNLSLSKNSVGLYQIAKVLVTPLICSVELAVYGRTVSSRRGVALLFACMGVALATVTDVRCSPVGALVAVASAVASAVLKVLQTHLLQRDGWTSLQLMERTWLAQLLLLVLLVPLFDDAAALQAYELTQSSALLVLASAACGFLLNVSSLFALGATSAVSVVLLGQCKTCSILLGGYLFFDARPRVQTLAGAALALTSVAAFTCISLAEQAQSQRVARAAQASELEAVPLKTAQ